MFKKIIIFIFVFNLFIFNSFAQENVLKKAIDDFKNLTLEDNNLLEKIEAYKKVIDLALEEAKDLKIKLVNLDKLTSNDLELQAEYLKELNNAINYYEKEKEDFLKRENIDLDFLKEKAENFKKWREENYVPLNTKIIDFILVKQQFKVLEITKNRYQKIETDFKKNINKIKNQKSLSQFNKFLILAKDKINLAEENYQKAENLFKIKYLKKDNLNKNEKFEISTFSSSSLDENIKEKNVKDFINFSFENIKEVYGYFLEISKLFRNF